jgi:hypothetical protein
MTGETSVRAVVFQEGGGIEIATATVFGRMGDG